MPTIPEEVHYDGATQKVARLGLVGLLDEVREIVQGFELRVAERRDANGGAAVRRMIDQQFEGANGWTFKKTGDVDWTKCHVVNGASLCVGVEIQFSARSDLLVVDLIHLRKAVDDGKIDIAVLVVPTDRLGHFLTDRGPKLSDAQRHIEAARVEDLPIILMAVEHDGPGPPLPKQSKRSREPTDRLSE
jgi:hypothetical protein